MWRKFFFWVQHHPWITIVSSLVLAFIMLNIAAYKHAQAMLNFIQAGERTEAPEALSGWHKVKILFSGVKVPKSVNQITPDQWDLPFEIHQVRVNAGIMLEAWYIPQAQAKGIVLLFHGYASTKSGLLPEARRLHELGYATFLVDFRGSGNSSGYQTSIGFYEADDVVKTVEYIRSISALSPLILYGRSMGGAAILRAVAAYNIQPEAIIVEAVFDKLLTTVQNRFATTGLPSFPAAPLLIFWGSVQQGFSGFKHNPIDYAARVTCPTLMLHGTDDPRATLAEGLAVFQALKGKKQFESFVGVGHEAYLAVRPEQWRHAVTQFLTQY